MSQDEMDSPRDRAARVVTELRESGHRALFVGGAVRDLLLGREPADYDVATSARPEEVAGIFPKVLPVGEKYGVVLVLVQGQAVEVASFRRDSVHGDGRRPFSVTYTDDPAEDARRRDFTVNGLFLDPATDEVLDFVDGLADLESRLVRAIGDPVSRFREDRLRMLRAVRFSAQLSFEIAEETRTAIASMAEDVLTVSGERIREELIKMLTGPAPGYALGLLLETGLLAAVLPEVAAMEGVEQPPEFHPEGDVFTHTCLVLECLESPSAVLALAALLHDVGKPPTFAVKERIRFDGHASLGAEMAAGICRRLRLSREETAGIEELVRDHLRFMEVKRMREAKLRRFLTGPLAEEHLALHRADCLGSHRGLRNWEFCRRRRDEYLTEPTPLPRLVTGRDLISLGWEPGPVFAQILSEVEDAQLEGRLVDREAALEYLRSRKAQGDAGDESQK